MAPRYAFTFQLADRDILGRQSPGHVATVISTPQQQTYSGLGPAFHDWLHLKGMLSPPSFKPQIVQREETPPRSSDTYNYSTTSGHDSHATYTVPITENQAERALAQIQQTGNTGDWFNFFKGKYCTNDVRKNAQAAELGAVLPYESPGGNRDHLANVERTLLADRRAKYVLDEAGRLIVDATGRPMSIPESLRQIQRDYANVGGGYDTPSERLGHVPSQSGPPNPHMWRSGTSPVEFVEPSNGEESSTAKAIRVLARRIGNGLRAPEARDSQDAGSPDSFDERFGEWMSSPAGTSPRNPNLPPQPQSGRPLGLVSGEPMPLWVTPPPIWGDLGRSKTPIDPDRQKEVIEDWLSGLLRRRIGR